MSSYHYLSSSVRNNDIGGLSFNFLSSDDEYIDKSFYSKVGSAAILAMMGLCSSVSNADLVSYSEHREREHALGYEVIHPVTAAQEDLSYKTIDSSELFLWHERVLDWLLMGNEDGALREISSVSTKLKSSDDKGLMDRGIRVILESDGVPEIILVALLRNTYTFKESVGFWNSLYEFTEERLIHSGRNPKRVLRGLKASYSSINVL